MVLFTVELKNGQASHPPLTQTISELVHWTTLLWKSCLVVWDKKTNKQTEFGYKKQTLTSNVPILVKKDPLIRIMLFFPILMSNFSEYEVGNVRCMQAANISTTWWYHCICLHMLWFCSRKVPKILFYSLGIHSSDGTCVIIHLVLISYFNVYFGLQTGTEKQHFFVSISTLSLLCKKKKEAL